MGEAPEVPAPEAQISCIMIAASVTPSPAPPYASGIMSPSQPRVREGLDELVRVLRLPSFSSQ